jgi:hypothetical protein
MDWDQALQRLSQGLSADEAQRWLRELPDPPLDLRGAWRRSLLRAALLHRCVPEGEGDRTTLRGVGLVLDALDDGLELRDVYELESALYGALQSDEVALWLEAGALAERGRGRWGGVLADTLAASSIERLVERGLVAEAKELLPRVRWRQHTVRALRALWPHGDERERAAWLVHTDAVLASSPLPPVYQAEPLSELILLTGSRERLAVLEHLVASLGPEAFEISADHEDPRISLLVARQRCGEDTGELLRSLPRDWTHWNATMRLLEAAQGPERERLIEEAWQTLEVWPETYVVHVSETLALDVSAGTARAMAWLRKGGGAAILEVLPEEVRDEAAALVRERQGEELLEVVEALARVGRLDEALRERLWAQAAEDPWWWRDAAPLLPARAHEEAVERMKGLLAQARSHPEREALAEGLRALDAWTEPRPEGRPRGDSLALDQLLRTLGWTLPRSLLHPRRQALAEVLGDELVEQMLSREDLPTSLPCPPEDFRARLLRPGWLSHEAGGWLAEQATSLMGAEAGGLLDDVLAWWRASR